LPLPPLIAFLLLFMATNSLRLKRMLRLTLEWSVAFKDLTKVTMEEWSSFLANWIQDRKRMKTVW
jgi:hypothetical protein